MTLTEEQQTQDQASAENQYESHHDLSALERAEIVVRRHMYISGGVGLIPVPVVDVIGVGANQLYMVKLISDAYEVPYNKNLVRSLISTLLSTLAASGTVAASASLIKSVPILGQVAGSVAMAAYSGAATYAIGKAFIMHFEAGGNLLNFDPEKMKKYFAEKFQEGKDMMKKKKAEGDSSTQ